MAATADDGLVVLFDGVCNLCNGAVQFIIDRDRAERFRFAPLQGESAKVWLDQHGVTIPEGDPDTMLLVEGDKLWTRSDAALRIARRLDGAWKVFAIFLVIPRFVRDTVYKFVARNRYRWFGRSETCRIPTPALRARFLP